METLKWYHSVLLIAITFGIINCNKEEISCRSNCLIFEGIVLDSYTNKPIKNGTVGAYLIPSSLGVYSEIEKGKTQTDKNGHFELRLEGEDLYKERQDWGIKCIKGGYLSRRLIDSGVNISGIDSTNFDKPINVDLNLIPSGTLRFNISESSQDFYYDLDFGNGLDRHYFWKISNLYTHANEVAGNRMTIITFYRGVSEINKDSIFVNVGEVEEINI
jgi:hypothetical protein